MKKECETIDLAMICLVQELGYAAPKNQIFQLSDAWERYCSLVAQTNGDIPPSFISRRTTFKEYLQNRLSDEYQLSRWSLSYNLRSHISYLTKSMFHVNPDDLMNHKEATKSRQKLDSTFQGPDEFWNV